MNVREESPQPMELLTIRAAARELSVSERTVKAAIDSGEIEAYQLGKRWQRVERTSLYNWIRRQRVVSADERGRRAAREATQS